MLPRHIQRISPTIYKAEFNPVELQRHPKILEKKLLKLFKPKPETHTYLTFEQILESEETR